MTTDETSSDTKKESENSSTAEGMTLKVVKGSFWTLVGQIVPIGLAFFATPIVARNLGAESYGLFVLVLLIPTYLSFADFGMNMASTKFGSGAFAAGDPASEAKIVRTAVLIALATSLPAALAIFILAPYLVDIFNVSAYHLPEAILSLRIASGIFVLNFLNNIVNTPQLARLRMDLNVFVASGFRILGIIATPIVVYMGGGVLGAVIVAMAVAIATLAGHLFVARRVLPNIFGLSIDRGAMRPMLMFGGPLVVAGIASVLLINLEKLVLARATSTETIAYYSVATTLAAMITLFSGSIAQSLLPAFSQLQNEKDRPALSALYSRGIRLTLIWVVPASVVMVLAAEPFFTVWFGPDYGRESPGPFYLTLLGFVFNVLTYFPYAIVMASGRSDIFAKIYWIELFPYIALVWWLANKFGASGAAAAWSIRIIVDGLILFWLARRIGKVAFVHHSLAAFSIALLIMLLPVAGLFFYGSMNLYIVFLAITCGIIYSFIVWKRILDRNEAAWLYAKIKGLLGG